MKIFCSEKDTGGKIPGVMQTSRSCSGKITNQSACMQAVFAENNQVQSNSVEQTKLNPPPPPSPFFYD